MTPIRALLGSACVAALSLGLMTPAGAAPQPVAVPPSPGALTSATNAMLQPGDVTGALAQGKPAMSDAGGLRTGFNAPPGGQDPLPVCAYGTQYSTVAIPGDLAVGFTAQSGTVNQDVYQYASAADARRTWESLSAQTRSRCSGTFTRGKTITTVTTSEVAGLPGEPAGLGVLSNGKEAQYSVLHLAGDSIQMLSYLIDDGPVAANLPAAANTLAAALATRWIGRAALPVTQDPLVTRAESAMVTAADLPAVLPVTSPAQGGWSSFTSYRPGYSPIICNARYDIPKASASFGASLGGDGGPLSIPGSIYQQIYVYPNAAAAQDAWTALTAGVRTCNDSGTTPISATESVDRSRSGTSAFTFNGVPGVWSRSLSTNPPDWSTKSYTIHLLVGDSIQMLTYSAGKRSVGNMPLDQKAVNVLAESLAMRWSR